MLVTTGNAGPVGLDHHRIGEYHLNQVSNLRDGGLTDSDNLPIFVPPELRKSEPIRHVHCVLVLRPKMALQPKAASTTATITVSQEGILIMLIVVMHIPPLRFANQI